MQDLEGEKLLILCIRPSDLFRFRINFWNY